MVLWDLQGPGMLMRESCKFRRGTDGSEDAGARKRFLSPTAARADQLEASVGSPYRSDQLGTHWKGVARGPHTLDDLVWQQVVELLRHPERLEGKYERRLDLMERNEKSGFDTGNLEKQRLQLENGKSRLIDSYAAGIIDKTDFEPKMQQLRNRLEQIDQQILDSRQKGAVQSELFLVINRLEEFAGAVAGKLVDTIDLEMKRRIALGLVKRIEIHKDEIVVVFRVDPQPGRSRRRKPE